MQSRSRWLLSAAALGVGSLVALSAYPLYVLGVQFGFLQPFPRPATVPASAHFVSAIELGYWFDCKVDAGRDVDVCSVWDMEGYLAASGDYRLECLGRAATKKELHPSMLDGSGIYLFGEKGPLSKRLAPMTGPGKNSCPHVTISYPDFPLSSKDGLR